MLNYDKISCHIQGLVTTYTERFGLAYIGLYRFQNAAEIQDWTGYLTVVNITLNREGLRPSHLWIRNGNERLLLLCVSGYFRTGMDDVTEILARLWNRRVSCGSAPTLIRDWRIEATDIGGVSNEIFQTLGLCTIDPHQPYRQRGFGYSVF